MNPSSFKVILILFTLLLASGWSTIIFKQQNSISLIDTTAVPTQITEDLKTSDSLEGGVSDVTGSTESSWGNPITMGKRIMSIIAWGFVGLYVPVNTEVPLEGIIANAFTFFNWGLSLTLLMLIFFWFKNKRQD